MFFFYSAVETGGYVNVTYSKMIINHKGRVTWMVPVVIKSACAVDVTYFPYDRQECYVQFGSWVYDYTQVDLQAMWSVPDLAGYITNNEFDLLQVSLKRYFNDENLCPGDARHPVITLYINVRRKSLYYDYLVIAPTLMLCVLTVVTFLLPTHCGEKINIGLTVFLTLYVLQLLIADNVPDSNQTPLLGKKYIFLLIIFH